MKNDCSTAKALLSVNRQLRQAQERDEPYLLPANTRAEFNISSLRPLAYSAYGSFHKAGPRLVGEYSLMAFGLVKTRQGMYYPAAVVKTDEAQLYGFGVSSQVMQTAAEDLGCPPIDIKFHTLAEAIKKSKQQLPGWMHIRAMA